MRMRTNAQRSATGAAMLASLLFLSASPSAIAQTFDTSAPTAILMDFNTDTILFEKDSDRAVPPASLVKLMTIAVIFHELEEGRLSPNDMFPVSEYAWRTGGAASGGSTMFLPLNSTVSVEDLIKGIAIQSGNDATIVAAEGIAGSVEAFAQLMNQRAAEIGLTGSHFTNPHGLPDPGQHVTMRDLAVLAEHLIREYPERYPLFSETEFTFNGITQRSRNPLLALGADGLKTGHTSEAGYGLVASAQEGGRRIVMAMTGMQSVNERAEEARKMMTWGLRSFQDRVVLAAGTPAAEADVRGGVAPTVALAPAEDLTVLAARGTESEFEIVVDETPSVEAPVAAGQEIGRVRVVRAGETVREAPLLAQAAVEQAPFMERAWGMALGYASDAGRAVVSYAREAGSIAYGYVAGLIQ